MSDSSSMSNIERAKRLEEKYKKEFPQGTPIIVACEKGNLVDLIVFIDRHIAVNTGVTVKQLLEEIGKDSDGYQKNTLMAAARWEEHAVLAELLSWGVDPSITDSIGQNALHYSAYNNKKSTRCTELLLKKMPLESINKMDLDEGTALDGAYLNDSPIKNDLVQLIRQYGGKANWYDRNGRLVGKGNGDLNDNNNVGSSSSGLSSSIPSKRKRVSSSSKKTKTSTKEDKCPICQQNILSNNSKWNKNDELFTENQQVIIAKCCGVAYHLDCFLKMVQNFSRCAACNTPLGLTDYRKPEMAIQLYNLKF